MTPAKPRGGARKRRTARPPASIIPPAQLAEAVRAACEQAALAAYEDAGLCGLCEAGRWEAALGALQSIDLERLIQELARTEDGPA